MSATFFIQECPTCSRMLQIRLELLGRLVACPQCDAMIVASDSALRSRPKLDSTELLLRAERLLATADERKHLPR